ncbi:ribonuclease H-like domain-containing protein [Tanacetum coccineum]
MAIEDDINKNGDSSKKNVGSSSNLKFSFGNSLYLHPNDTGGSPIVTIKLTRTENYKMWSIAMTFALRNHNKLDFIDGSCKRDSDNPALANQCDICNSVVVTWILNSLSCDLFVGAIYAKTAYEMCNDLKETYDKVDGSAVFNLHKSINSLNQNGSTLAEYYNNLNSLWKQFDAMISLPLCTCEAAKHFEKHNQLIKLMQFLMGLDESYLAIRSNLLTREPLPNVKNAFAVISGEESHRNVTSIRTTKLVATAFTTKTFDNNTKKYNNNFKGSGFNSNSNNRGPNPNLKCTNCNKLGYTVDRCFKLVGYPAGYVKRNFNSNTRPVSSNTLSADVHSNGVSSNNATTSNSLVSLSNEQLARLTNLLMIMDLKENRTVGIGKQYNGLYLSDGDNACKIVSNNCIAFCFVSKPLWHQRLGHPTDQVLDALKTTLNLDSYSTSDHLCETCNKAKQTRELFPLSDHKSTKISELVHLDVWGPYKGNADSKATSMDENNNTHPEGTVPNETDFVNDFYENSEFNSKVKDLPANTVRRSSRQTKLPTSLNDFVIEGKVKYGVEKVVNCANLNHENFFFTSSLNKSVEPTCYEEAMKAIDYRWIYKIEYKASGDIDRFKARLVSKGFNQKKALTLMKLSLLLLKSTILQISSAIRHISNIDNMYIKSYSFSLFSSLPVSHSLWSSQSFGHQKAINGFDMPLPVAVCSGLVNPLAPRKGKFHGGLITMSTLCT